MSNSIYRVFVEKLGGSGISTTFVGNEGELFWDPTTTALKVSDGTTAGGVGISGGGGSYGDTDVEALFQSYSFHLLPSVNAQYDIGSAEFKVRHLFLSDNSLWIGDDHKMDSKSGGIKFRKRKNDVVPSTVTTAGGDEAGALAATGASSLSEITLSQWLAYLTSLDGTKTDVEDLYPAEDAGTYSADDYDSVVNEAPSHKLTATPFPTLYLDRGERVCTQSVMTSPLDIVIHNAGGVSPYGGTFEVDIWITGYYDLGSSGGINSLTIDGTAVTPKVVGTFSNEIVLYNIKAIQVGESAWKAVVTLS